MRFAVVLLAAVMALGLCLAPARAERRVALVVGNNSYANLPEDQQLKTAVNDAHAVGDALRRLGFEVIEGENLSRGEFGAKLDELTRKLSPGDTALFYFAGHGVTLSGGNYLLPSDIPNVESGQESLLAWSSLSEDDIVANIRSRGVRAVVVLDACRNNPFKRGGQRSVGGERGLSRIEATSGVFKLYSAGIGQSALDRLSNNDPNPDSVFTRVLVPELSKPGLDLTEMAKEVGREVQRLASTVGHEQQPAYYDQILDDVYLAGAPSTDQKPPKPSGAATSFDEAERAWSDTKGTTSHAVLEEFIRRFGDSYYASLARARLQELQNSQVAAVVPPVGSVQAPQTASSCGSAAMTVSFSSRTSCPLSATEERSLQPKELFKECDKCPEMVVAPAGSFVMGSPENEKERLNYEGPQHRVTIRKPFAVGRFAVTFDEWDACVADGACGGYRPDDQGWGRGRRPVVDVSWSDAKAYVAWLSSKTGKAYRLLSEAEREYVTRAGTKTPFWWGASITPEQANYDGHYNYDGGPTGEDRQRTMPVDSFAANPFGLYQVHGNIAEWVEDCWHKSYSGAPTDGSAWIAGDCEYRVTRGGPWFVHPFLLRSAYREKGKNDRYKGIGFRVARTLAPR
jgi:formylglycine-generating enzyme required for sulfatase activity